MVVGAQALDAYDFGDAFGGYAMFAVSIEDGLRTDAHVAVACPRKASCVFVYAHVVLCGDDILNAQLTDVMESCSVDETAIKEHAGDTGMNADIALRLSDEIHGVFGFMLVDPDHLGSQRNATLAPIGYD